MTFLSFLFFFSLSANAQQLDAAQSPCLKKYETHRNHMAVVAGVAPVVGVGAVTGSAMMAFSYVYGGFNVIKASAVAPIAEVAFSTVIPTAAVATLVGLEAFSITKFTLANHALHLMKDVYGEGNGRMLRKLTRRVQKSRPDLSMEAVKALILKADFSGALCDGSLTRHNHGLAMMPAMKAYLLQSSEQDELDDEDASE